MIYKNYVKKDKCEICGEDNKWHLIVHHKDGSRRLGRAKINNNPDNLMTLCTQCHGEVHMLLSGRKKQKEINDLDRKVVKEWYDKASKELGVSKWKVLKEIKEYLEQVNYQFKKK